MSVGGQRPVGKPVKLQASVGDQPRIWVATCLRWHWRSRPDRVRPPRLATSPAPHDIANAVRHPRCSCRLPFGDRVGAVSGPPWRPETLKAVGSGGLTHIGGSLTAPGFCRDGLPGGSHGTLIGRLGGVERGLGIGEFSFGLVHGVIGTVG